MKAYKIQFYKRRRDWDAAAVYYREFPNYLELIAWCNDMQSKCGYYRYFYETISAENYLNVINKQQ